jgi:RsiW-degrading membrane proteinase PrsW (M82 family)
MELLLLIAAAFAPGVFLLWYIYKKDKYEPEPKALVIKTFVYGILIAIPVSIAEVPFGFSQLLLVVVAAPIIEEYAKYLVVKRGVYRSAEFNEPMDGLVYSSAAALGFASIENLVYLAGSSSVVQLMITRAFLSVPGHMLFSSMWGYALGQAKFLPPERRTGIIASGLGMAMLSHAGFNFLLITNPYLSFGVLVLIPILWKVFKKRIEEFLDISPFKRTL